MTSIYNNQYSYLSELLIQSRKDKKLRQEDIADSLGKPQSFVSKYESGGRRLDVIEFLEMADALEIDPYKVIEKLQEPS